MPDGGHIHREDRTFLVLKNIKVDNTNSANKKAKKQKKKKKEDGNEQTSSVESETRTLYGVGYFLSKNDSTVKRGAIQKALLILSYHPYFELFSLINIAFHYSCWRQGDYYCFILFRYCFFSFFK